MLGISRGYPRLAGLFAWAAMVLFLASGFGIRYLAGTLGDPDISNLVEAVFIPVVVMSLPLGAVALGVYAPCVQALGTMMGRVLSVPERLVIGVLLAVPAFLAIAVVGNLIWPPTQGFVTVFIRQLSHPNTPSLVATLVVGGLAATSLESSSRLRAPSRLRAR